ncbi:hypothetical protein FB451DRAFT_1181940 [Mycena latifolia]|nr:hypothetical protein FB451DRAFT_1181940 [Mycena latifolia]
MHSITCDHLLISAGVLPTAQIGALPLSKPSWNKKAFHDPAELSQSHFSKSLLQASCSGTPGVNNIHLDVKLTQDLLGLIGRFYETDLKIYVIIYPKLIPYTSSAELPVDGLMEPYWRPTSFKYTVGHPEILTDDMGGHRKIDLLIKRELARTTGTRKCELTEEIDYSCDRMVGGDGWKEIGATDSLADKVGRVSSRGFLGKE